MAEHQPLLPFPSNLPAAELANLSLRQETAIRAAVATHPNTAPYILGTLATEFPAEVLANPALPLLRLADPTILQRWPDTALLALVKQANAPMWVRKLALTHPRTEIQVALASQEHATIEEIQLLAQHSSWLVRARIASRSDISQAVLDQLAEDSHYAVRLAVASRVSLPIEQVQRFLGDSSRFVRQEAMRQAQMNMSAS